MLFFQLCCKAMVFIPFWYLSQSVLLCLQNCIKNSPDLQTIVQHVTSNSVFLLAPPPPPPQFLCYIPSVYTCVCAHLCEIQYYDYVTVDLVKCGMLTHVGEIEHHRLLLCGRCQKDENGFALEQNKAKSKTQEEKEHWPSFPKGLLLVMGGAKYLCICRRSKHLKG